MKGIILAGGSGTRLQIISINKGDLQTDHAGI